MPYYVKIARHYEEARKHEEAERYYVAADMPKHAVNMYASAGKWDAAHRVATGYLTESEIKHFYTQKASELEGARKLRDAEKMFITVKEYDLAINMYPAKPQSPPFPPATYRPARSPRPTLPPRSIRPRRR